MLTLNDTLKCEPFEKVVTKFDSIPYENRFGQYRLSNGWFIKKKFFGGYDGFKATDICWIYPNKTTHKTNFVTTGVSWETVMRLRPNKEIHLFYDYESTSNDKEAVISPNSDYTIKTFNRIVPWAMFGYSAYLMECWNKHKELFLSVVDARLSAIQKAIKDKKIIIKDDDSVVIKTPVTLPTINMRFNRNAKGKIERIYEVNPPL